MNSCKCREPNRQGRDFTLVIRAATVVKCTNQRMLVARIRGYAYLVPYLCLFGAICRDKSGGLFKNDFSKSESDSYLSA